MIRGVLARAGSAAGAALLTLSMAQAGVVDYAVTPLGGNLWRYDYTINNTTPSIGFDELTVFFDVSKYELLAAPTAPPGWDPLVVQPDTGIPADGYYDVLSLSWPVADGATIPGFSISFAYLAPGSPGAQAFDLLDSSSFTVVHSGTTSPVPESTSAALMPMGLGFIGALLRKRRRQPS